MNKINLILNWNILNEIELDIRVLHSASNHRTMKTFVVFKISNEIVAAYPSNPVFVPTNNYVVVNSTGTQAYVWLQASQ